MTSTLEPLIIDRALAAEVAGVSAGTVRQWIHRGHLTARADGVDLRELIAWLDSRNPDMLATRAGLTGEARAATHTTGNRAARMLAQALTLNRQRVTPGGNTDTPETGPQLHRRPI